MRTELTVRKMAFTEYTVQSEMIHRLPKKEKKGGEGELWLYTRVASGSSMKEEEGAMQHGIPGGLTGPMPHTLGVHM